MQTERPRIKRQKKETGYIIVVFQLILQQFNTRRQNRKTISTTKASKLGYRSNVAVAHGKGGEIHQSSLTSTKSGVKCLSHSFHAQGRWQELERFKCHNSTVLDSGGVRLLPGSALLVAGRFGRVSTSHLQREDWYLQFSTKAFCGVKKH